MKEETAFQAIVWAKLGEKLTSRTPAAAGCSSGKEGGTETVVVVGPGRKPRNGESVGENMKTLPTIPHLTHSTVGGGGRSDRQL